MVGDGAASFREAACGDEGEGTADAGSGGDGDVIGVTGHRGEATDRLVEGVA